MQDSYRALLSFTSHSCSGSKCWASIGRLIRSRISMVATYMSPRTRRTVRTCTATNPPVCWSRDCEENEENQWKWFPPMTVFDDPTALGHGSVVVIDPRTLTFNRLSLENFPQAFITHGIDTITTPDEPTAVYIFAANHLPSPD